MSKLPFAFEDDTRSIRIDHPWLPAPWINYLSNSRFHAFISQAGGGFAWWKSPLIYRLTRYRAQHGPIDSPGFYLYVVPEAGSLWSPTARPLQTCPEPWSVRHQPGQSIFSGASDGLEVEVRFFVAPDFDCLIWDVYATNRTAAIKRFSLVPYVEFSQLQWQEESTWGYYIRHMIKTDFDPKARAVTYLYHHQNHPFIDEVPIVYLASTVPVTAYSGDRESFLGPYGSEAQPGALKRLPLGNQSIGCGDPAAALQIDLHLSPGESSRLAFLLGAEAGGLTRHQESLARVRSVVEALESSSTRDTARASLDQKWEAFFTPLQAEVPELPIQRQLNIWTPVNCLHTGRFSRAVNTLAPGIRGIGFRDTAQDMLAIAPRDPIWARQMLTELCSFQRETGSAIHLAYREEPYPPTQSIHSDDHLWPILLAYALVAETGDAHWLSEDAVPFADDLGRPQGPPVSVWEHLVRALDFTENHIGSHGLALTLASDWNDIIGKFSREGRGESVFSSALYLVGLSRMAELADHLGLQDQAQEFRRRHAVRRLAIETHAWDGEWWLCGFDDNGNPLGSHRSEFGKLFLYPQCWAIFANVGTLDQQRSSMDAVHRLLNTDCGLKLLTPGFLTWPDRSDPFTGYGPGCGENGAVFCHSHTWGILAEATLRRADRAWNYYRTILPERLIETVGLERYQAEPYAWVSNIVGPENPRFGWGNVSHITGTAAWMEVVATQYMLGLRAELEGFRVDPVLPTGWKGFRATRSFRGTRLKVTVQTDGTPGARVHSIEVNGQPFDITSEPMIPASVLRGASEADVRVVLK